MIRMLQAELPQYDDIVIPDGEEGQKQQLRSLMNQRPPIPAARGFLSIQDDYLTEENRKRGIVDCEELPPAGGDSRLILWQGISQG